MGIAAILLMLASAVAPAPADSPTSKAIEGAWALESMVQVRPDGSTLPPAFMAGSSFEGFITYAPEGWMSLHIVGLPRPNAARPADAKTYPAEQAVAVLGGYYSYFGQYEYDPGAGRVRHKIKQSLRPHEAGMTNERLVSIAGNRMTLESPPSKIDGELRSNRLVWRRLGPN